MRLSIIAVMAVLGLSACSDPVQPHGPVVVDIAAAGEVQSGGVLPVGLTMRNVTSDSVLVNLGGLPDWHHDVVVNSEDGALVWQRITGARSLPLRAVWLAPLETLEFTTEWTLVDNEGNAVPPGEYVVRGTIFAAPQDYATRSVRVRVLP
jgi:hypothetical protein